MDILKREKEFKKLNEELDKKTKSIIEKSTNISTLKENEVTQKNEISKNKNLVKQKGSIYKANTIPKRFRDSLTNRKPKIVKTSPSVSEKSVQISEDELNSEVEIDYTETEAQICETNYNCEEEIEENENLVIETEDEIKYSEFKEKIQTKKANTVPKSQRDNLTQRKSKNLKLTNDKSMQVNNEKKQNDNEEEKHDTLKTTTSSNASTSRYNFQNISQNSTKTNTIDSSSTKSTKCLQKFEPNLPKKNLSAEGLVKFLKSKVSILEVELTNTKNEVAKYARDLEASYESQQKFENQRDQAISKNNSLTEQIEKLTEKVNEFEKRYKDRETEFNNCKKEIENSKRDTKVLNQANKNIEKRLYRANEELEAAKNNLDAAKKNEKNSIETARIEKDKLEKQMKDLKRQRNDFLNSYKKQLFLIDNLKRQNICMEQCELIGFGEKQFSKILELSKD